MLEALKVCIACSHGGHLTEALQVVEAFQGADVFFISYDRTAARTRPLGRKYLIPHAVRSPWAAVSAVVQTLWILLRERPDVVFSTGGEIAIWTFAAARFICGSRLVFLESVAQVTQPSLTGRILYRISDVFLVQWPQLLRRYGARARCEGRVL